jgi:thymidine phosphorylase
VVDVAAPRAGFVARIDTEALGLVVVDLGGGRRREGDRVDPAVGLSRIAGIGEEVGPGRPLARVHARTPAAAEAAAARVAACFALGEEALDPPPLVRERVAP